MEYFWSTPSKFILQIVDFFLLPLLDNF